MTDVCDGCGFTHNRWFFSLYVFTQFKVNETDLIPKFGSSSCMLRFIHRKTLKPLPWLEADYDDYCKAGS